MTIEINGTTVIDNSKNLLNTASVGFQDGSSQTTAGSDAPGTTAYTSKQLIKAFRNPNVDGGTTSGDEFGMGVAIEGNYIAISAPYEERALLGSDGSSADGTNHGVIYFYENNELVHVFKNPDYQITSSQRFGTSKSLVINGNYLIAAAPYYQSNAGFVSVFNIKTRNFLYHFYNPNTGDTTTGNDYFGWDFDAKGNYLIVGAPYQEYYDAGLSTMYYTSGSAYIYDLNSGRLMHELRNPSLVGTQALDYFGKGVAIHPPYAIVGAPEENETGGGTGYNVGAVYIFNIFTGELIHSVANPETSHPTNDFFGTSVAINETHFFVTGERWLSTSSTTSTGRIWVFDIETATLQRYIDNPTSELGQGGGGGDAFGATGIRVSGNYLVTSSTNEEDPLYYTTSDSQYVGNGAVYVFDWTNGDLVKNWTLSELGASEVRQWAQLGLSIDISGNKIMMGTSGQSLNGNDSGAYLTQINDSYNINGVKEITFDNGLSINGHHKAFQIAHYQGDLIRKIYNPTVYDPVNHGSNATEFGCAVDVHGNFAIIGEMSAYGDVDTGSNVNQGRVHIYDLTKRKIVKTIENPNKAALQLTNTGDVFGYSVAISDDFFVVGVPYEDTIGKASNGVAYVYDLKSYELLHVLFNYDNDNGTEEKFGESVAIEGHFVLVGAPKSELDAGAIAAPEGAAYLYDARSGDLKAYLTRQTNFDQTEEDVDGGDEFGTAVAISGQYMAVGAPYDGVYGQVYVFFMAAQITLNPYGTEGDVYGPSVSSGAKIQHIITNPDGYTGSVGLENFGEILAADGDWLAVGVEYEGSDSDPFGDDPLVQNPDGKVYVYSLSTGNLIWTFENPDHAGQNKGDGDRASDLFGSSIDISGNTLIVGARGVDNYTADDVGCVYLFDLKTGKSIKTITNPWGDQNDQFGNWRHVAIHDNYIVVGNSLERQDQDSNGQPGARGAAYVYAAKDITYFDKLTSLVKI
jgi:hypothetical protein